MHKLLSAANAYDGQPHTAVYIFEDIKNMNIAQ
jgi:hypothetical protein